MEDLEMAGSDHGFASRALLDQVVLETERAAEVVHLVAEGDLERVEGVAEVFDHLGLLRRHDHLERRARQERHDLGRGLKVVLAAEAEDLSGRVPHVLVGRRFGQELGIEEKAMLRVDVLEAVGRAREDRRFQDDGLARLGYRIQRLAQERIIETRPVEIVGGRYADEDNLRVFKDRRVIKSFGWVVERYRHVLGIEPALKRAPDHSGTHDGDMWHIRHYDGRVWSFLQI